MKEHKEASIMLEAIDELAPICVDWNNEELWMRAITEGLRRIRAAKTETPGAATPRESKKQLKN